MSQQLELHLTCGDDGIDWQSELVGTSAGLGRAESLVGRGVLQQVQLEVSKLTVASVVDAVLVILRIELEGWVSLGALKTFNLVGVAFKPSNDQVVRHFLR